MGSKKSPAPTPPPQPVVTPVQQKPVEPINRTATSAEARDRADQNKSAELLASTSDDDQTKTANQASMMS